jgi:phosphoribosylformylglycinamidine (FGAM) synthase-like enzyme
METFWVVRDRDVKAHGEYRAKRLILEIYDEMAEAIATGRPYQTRLDPPPADAGVVHAPHEVGAAAE